MYISLSWQAADGVDPDLVEAEIFSVVEALAFDNILNAVDGLFLADIRHGEDREQVQELHNRLRDVAPNRFSYVVTVSPDGWDLVASRDIPRAPLRTIVDYST